MAENKKSFIAYSDWKETFDSLPDEYAGKLIKHIFAYVNDENPTTECFVINSVFANIKNALKRDLDKWEAQLEQRSQAGKKSAEARQKRKKQEDQRNSTTVKTRTTKVNEEQRNSTDNVNVSVSVNDNVILLEKETKDIYIEKEPKFNFKNELLIYGFREDLVKDWLLVRKNKKSSNTQTAFNKFIKQVELNGADKNLILEECVTKSWAGFESSWFTQKPQLQKPLIQTGKSFEQLAMEDYERYHKHKEE